VSNDIPEVTADEPAVFVLPPLRTDTPSPLIMLAGPQEAACLDDACLVVPSAPVESTGAHAEPAR
jgi:hypothetical protein